MKAVILISLVLFLFSCSMCETIPEDKENLEIINEIDLSKDEIFDKCLQWMAKTFVSSKEVIEYKNKELGKIIGNGRIYFISGGIVKIPVSYTLTIEVKEKKYRMIFENLIAWFGKFSDQPGRICFYDHLLQVHRNFQDLSNKLNQFLIEKEKEW